MINRIIMIIMALGAVAGGIDRILGNRFGYGKKFEEGFQYLGPTALSMVGIICLAPLVSGTLGRLIIPVYRFLGVDPAMFGSLLAIDMGGYQLSMELAENPLIGRYAGIVAASVFGCTIVFTIPVGMGLIEEGDRPVFAKGIMLGLAAMPAALITGGAVCGLWIGEILHQNLPVLVLALLLGTGLFRIPDGMVKGFEVFAVLIRTVITAGLVLAAVTYMTGFVVIPGMAPIEEAMAVVSSIGVVLLGSLPVTEFLTALYRAGRQNGAGQHQCPGAAGQYRESHTGARHDEGHEHVWQACQCGVYGELRLHAGRPSGIYREHRAGHAACAAGVQTGRVRGCDCAGIHNVKNKEEIIGYCL